MEQEIRIILAALIEAVSPMMSDEMCDTFARCVPDSVEEADAIIIDFLKRKERDDEYRRIFGG